MKQWIACFLLATLLLSAGCDTVNHSQVQILPARNAQGTVVATVPASEREAVKQILAQIAVRQKLEDRTSLSLHPDILCAYAQPITTQPPMKNPMRLTAWVYKDRVVIDLTQEAPETGEPLAYQNLRSQVIEELKKQFGDRVIQVHKTQQATGRTDYSP